jgi:hypothetical protein
MVLAADCESRRGHETFHSLEKVLNEAPFGDAPRPRGMMVAVYE